MAANMSDKRAADMQPDSIQHGNRSWWTSNTMSYDWKDKLGGERFGREWFEAADARFVDVTRAFRLPRLIARERPSSLAMQVSSSWNAKPPA